MFQFEDTDFLHLLKQKLAINVLFCLGETFVRERNKTTLHHLPRERKAFSEHNHMKCISPTKHGDGFLLSDHQHDENITEVC